MQEEFLRKRLGEREEQGNLRRLPAEQKGLIDFCSNDYLGLARSGKLMEEMEGGNLPAGSTGSRLLTGNYALIEEAEQEIARFHQARSGLVFSSGYDANLGLLSSVPQRGDTVLYDYLSHASLRDGIRLSFAASASFRHNDLDDLENKLRKAAGNRFVVTESVFSMDGDLCPLRDMVGLCEKYGANLVVDEAHATGVIGDRGEGLAQAHQLQDRVFARIHTFGKACGLHGAIVLGSTELTRYLVNFARPFIYSTAPPPVLMSQVRMGYRIFPQMQEERRRLREHVQHFRLAGIRGAVGGESPIQAIVVPGNQRAKQVAGAIREQGVNLRPILYPTVPRGLERLRVVLHAFNTDAERDLLLNLLKNSL